MSDTPETIISDDEIIRVHAYANFGSMAPRAVVNDGVRKYAVGYQGGSTQIAILREHGLITKTKGCGYNASLTLKGKRYARSIYHREDLLTTKEQIMDDPRVKALVDKGQALLDLNDNHSPFSGEMYRDRVDRTWDNFRAAIAQLKDNK